MKQTEGENERNTKNKLKTTAHCTFSLCSVPILARVGVWFCLDCESLRSGSRKPRRCQVLCCCTLQLQVFLLFSIWSSLESSESGYRSL